MAKVDLVWKRPDDGLSVTLEMHVDGEPKAHMIVDAGQLEAIIHDLAAVRAEMTEQVAPSLDPGAMLQTIPDPVWIAQNARPQAEAAALALRHPGFGWLSFLQPAKEARALGKILMAIADELEAKGGPEEGGP